MQRQQPKEGGRGSGEDASAATGSAGNRQMRSDRSPLGLPIVCDGSGTPAPTDLPASPLPAPRPVRLLSGEQPCPHFSSSRLGRVSSCQAEARKHTEGRRETGHPPRAPSLQAGPGTPGPMRTGSIPGPPPPAAASHLQLVKTAATTTTETPFKL